MSSLWLTKIFGKLLNVPTKKKIKDLYRIEGIIVKTIDYQEFDKILYVFTKTEGMRTFMAKNANRQKNRGSMPSSPLTHAEFLFENPDYTMPTCREITPISYHLGLRKNIQQLTDACKMASALYDTLLPNKESPLLFALLNCYLCHMTSSPNSSNLLASFLLKLLKHEGIFTLPLRCGECEQNLEEFYVSYDGFYCESHVSDRSLYFNCSEQQMLTTLLHARQLIEVDSLPTNSNFLTKVDSLHKKLLCQIKG